MNEVLDHDNGLAASHPRPPDDSAVFRMAQLLLLLETCKSLPSQQLGIDRLAYYDFFSANPFIVLSDGSNDSETDATKLRAAGFLRTQLSYASTSNRFVSRRQRIRNDLARLVATSLVAVTPIGYQINSSGSQVVEQFTSLYADAYRLSSELVVKRLRRLSNSALENAATHWLGQSWLLIDLLAIPEVEESGDQSE